jgi:membrane-associated protease RseP (regulator of RpoE activity)
MNTKKIIAIISLIVLIIAVVAFAVWVKSKPTKEQRAFASKFAQDMQAAKNETSSGTIEEITGEKLVLLSGTKIRTELKINQATPVMFMDKAKKMTAGQISDVKVGDLVDLQYDRKTAAVVLIIKFKP